jgi:hypothetical protein
MALLTATQAGCLVLAAGAAGGAAVGYVYAKGRVSQTYNANFQDTMRATETALVELGLPVVARETDPSGGSLESRTGQKERVQVYLETVASRIPAEGSVTKVSVRVATFGDQQVSEKILNQIGYHLAPANLPPPGQPVQPSAATSPPQTPPPPLAPVPSVKP